MENYLSIEFRLERERHYLLKNPFQAITLALNYLEDFLNLAREFRTLERKNQTRDKNHIVLDDSVIEKAIALSLKKLEERQLSVGLIEVQVVPMSVRVRRVRK